MSSAELVQFVNHDQDSITAYLTKKHYVCLDCGYNVTENLKEVPTSDLKVTDLVCPKCECRWFEVIGGNNVQGI